MGIIIHHLILIVNYFVYLFNLLREEFHSRPFIITNKSIVDFYLKTTRAVIRNAIKQWQFLKVIHQINFHKNNLVNVAGVIWSDIFACLKFFRGRRADDSSRVIWKRRAFVTRIVTNNKSRKAVAKGVLIFLIVGIVGNYGVRTALSMIKVHT